MDWNDMAQAWIALEHEMEAAHRPVLDDLMRRAAPGPGQRVLDIGCGMGASLVQVLEAVGPGGGALGLDISQRMLDRARERVKGRADLIVADAQTYALPPAHFDAAVSLFGVMFFDDAEAAFANILGAMKPNAPLTFAAWGPRGDNPWFRIPARIAQGRMGAVPPVPVGAPGPFAFEIAEPVLGALGAAGWQGATVETVDTWLTPQGTPSQVAALMMQIGAARMVMDATEATADDEKVIAAGLAEAFADLDGPQGVRVPARIHFFSARAPG